jgi:hypothetical protein
VIDTTEKHDTLYWLCSLQEQEHSWGAGVWTDGNGSQSVPYTTDALISALRLLY